MNIAYEYRRVDNPENCLFKATSVETGEVWSAEVKRPYPIGHDFWHENQYSRTVVNKSKKIAEQNSAPEWVYKD